MAKQKKEEQEKLRLRIKAYDSKLIDNSARQIVEAAKRQDAAAQLTELRRRSASPLVIARCKARLDLGQRPQAEDWARYRKTIADAIERVGPDARSLRKSLRTPQHLSGSGAGPSTHRP